METTTFHIDRHGEPAAGIVPYFTVVQVTTDSDPGGEPGEFASFIADALGEWFDGARVRPAPPEEGV